MAKTERGLAVRHRYGTDGKAFLQTFNPDNQLRFTLDIRRAYRGDAPALTAVGEAYGRGTARSWLMIQLQNLSEFAGCKEKLSLLKLEEVANIILTEYGYLKVTELMDFFRKFKAGRYGKFYGAVDPMVITSALVEFMRERSATLASLDQQQREVAKWLDPDYVCYRRRAEAHRRRRIFYSRNFYSPDFSFEEFSEIWWLFNMGYERKGHGYMEN